MFPADLILLASSIHGGNAYIETASLDGKPFQLLRLEKSQTESGTTLNITIS